MSIYEEMAGKLDELHGKIRPDNVDEWLDDVRKTMNIFLTGEKITQFRKILECVTDNLERDSNKKEQLKEIYGLINRLKAAEPDFLIERLKIAGWSIAKRERGLQEAINKEALRLLEQIRLGKRDAVVGMLMRNFIVRNIKFPIELVEAIKPKYDINLFRAFMYAFLSSFTSEKIEAKEVDND